MTDTRVSQAALLVAGSDTSALRLSQAALLVAGSDTSALRLSQAVLLVLGSGDGIYADVLTVTPSLPNASLTHHVLGDVLIIVPELPNTFVRSGQRRHLHHDRDLQTGLTLRRSKRQWERGNR